MSNFFIDCGTQFGNGLTDICNLETITENYSIYTFEANPNTFQNIKKSKKVRYFNVAVSDYYGFSEFNCEFLDNDRGFTGGGSTLNNLNQWNTEKVYGTKPNYKQTLVPVIDITDFINKLNPSEKSIVMKLDVEGEEYRILNKMRELDIFKYIKVLYIEFHDHIISENPYETSGYWCQYFIENNIRYVLWH